MRARPGGLARPSLSLLVTSLGVFVKSKIGTELHSGSSVKEKFLWIPRSRLSWLDPLENAYTETAKAGDYTITPGDSRGRREACKVCVSFVVAEHALGSVPRGNVALTAAHLCRFFVQQNIRKALRVCQAVDHLYAMTAPLRRVLHVLTSTIPGWRLKPDPLLVVRNLSISVL